MLIRRVISALTFFVGLLALAFGALLVFNKGFSISHWLVLEKILIACVSFIASALLWQGHRFMGVAGGLAWGLTAVWVTSVVVAGLFPR